MDGMAGVVKGLTVQVGVVEFGDVRPYCVTDTEARRAVDIARARHAALPAPEEREATVQTVRRLRRDAVHLLHADGRLDRVHVSAAAEILLVFSAITSAVQGRVTASYAERGDKAGAGADLPPTLKAAYVERYTPWRDWAGRAGIGGAKTLADLTLLFVVDNLGPRQVEDSLGIRHGVSVRQLQHSLFTYARMAGWVRDWHAVTVTNQD